MDLSFCPKAVTKKTVQVKQNCYNNAVLDWYVQTTMLV